MYHDGIFATVSFYLYLTCSIRTFQRLTLKSHVDVSTDCKMDLVTGGPVRTLSGGDDCEKLVRRLEVSAGQGILHPAQRKNMSGKCSGRCTVTGPHSYQKRRMRQLQVREETVGIESLLGDTTMTVTWAVSYEALEARFVPCGPKKLA